MHLTRSAKLVDGSTQGFAPEQMTHPNEESDTEPQNRDTAGRFLPGVSGNPGGRPLGFAAEIREQTRDGAELIEFMLAVFRGEHGEDIRTRADAATWLADRGHGKPIPIREFEVDELPTTVTFVIGEPRGDAEPEV